MTYFTDADIEMAELAEAGRMVANGVCPVCEECLDPSNPKWNLTQTEQDSIRSCYGPHGNVVEGYHDRCINGEDDWY